MKIKKVKYVDGMQGEAVISLNRSELCKLCNGLYLLSKHKENEYDKNLHTQMRVIRDILDYGEITFNTAVAIKGEE